MDEVPHDDLTTEERAALTALPRELAPSRLLEERTVSALRERGLLREPRRTAPRFWRAGAIAAGFALFATGMVVGQWTGSRAGSPVRATVPPAQATTQYAVEVQEAGTAYVRALAVMVESINEADAQQRTQAREVAVAPFWAAANELVRIAPDDPLVGGVIERLQQRAFADDRAEPRAAARHVIWF